MGNGLDINYKLLPWGMDVPAYNPLFRNKISKEICYEYFCCEQHDMNQNISGFDITWPIPL